MSPLTKFIQISDPRIVLLCLSGYAFYTGIFGVYINSVVTTVEKRFDLTASQMGALMGANDIGYVCCVIFIAYYSNRVNKAVILFLSAVGFLIACLFYIIPYAVFGPKFPIEKLKTLESDGNGTNEDDAMCVLSTTSSSILSSTASELLENGRNMAYEKSVSFALHMIGGIISGIATCPFWNVGLAMVDDMTGEGSGIYLSALLMIRSIAPILGYWFGGWMITLNETMKINLDDFPPGQKDPLWIGAWWMGYLIMCFLVIILAPFMLMLKVKTNGELHSNANRIEPTEIPLTELRYLNQENGINVETSPSKEKPATRNDQGDGDLSEIGLKDLLQILRLLWTNPVYVSIIAGMVFEVFAFVGIYSFFTKYLEVHFRATPSISSVLTGIAIAGSAFVSTFVSGLVSKYFPMSLRGKNRYHFIVNTLSALLFSILFFFQCSSEKIVGYDHESSVNSTCIEQCNCDAVQYKSVCSAGVTYLSPCHAGCSLRISQTTYGSCDCLITNGTNHAERGDCSGTCTLLYPYIAVFFIVKLIGNVASVQFSQIVMNLYGKKTKPVALACIGFIYGIFGLILPVVNGAIIDQVCLLNNKAKDDSQSFCVLYDVKKMHYLFHGLAFVAQLPACFCYLYSWLKTPDDSSGKDLPERSNIEHNNQ